MLPAPEVGGGGIELAGSFGLDQGLAKGESGCWAGNEGLPPRPWDTMGSDIFVGLVSGIF